VSGADNAFGYAVELLDPAQLDHQLERPAANGGNQIVMGVELDRWQRPVAYHLFGNHPSEPNGRQRMRVAADEMIHCFLRRRVKQVRGVTWFAPVLIDLAMHGGFREAHLVASRASSAKMGFIELDPETEALEATETDADGKPYVPFEAAAGVIEQLPAGMKFKPWDPSFPSTNFGQFDDAILRSIATGMRLSSMSVSSNLQGTSWSSGRLGLEAERAVFKWLQQRRVLRYCTPIFQRWLKAGLVSGAIKLPMNGWERYLQATWHPKPFQYVEPEKDLSVRRQEVRMGVNSLTRIAAERGRLLSDILKERAAEEKLAEELGVEIDLSELGTGSAGDAETETDGVPPRTKPVAADEADDPEPGAQLAIAGSRRSRRAQLAPSVRLLNRGTHA
jgi:lambda family phage portal protein